MSVNPMAADAATLNAAVDDLLCRAETAYKGADLALNARDTAAYDRLMEKSRVLRREAHEIDPRHRCPAWAAHATT